jgi:hypothetical protein
MRIAPLALALLFLINLLFSGCVSVKLATEEQERAQANKINFQDPISPFTKTDLSQADKAWQSPKTGNSISYFSDCKSSSLPLKAIRTNIFTGVESLKILDEGVATYNAREALRSIVIGKMEGVPIKINLIIFKKNMCTYSLSYVALLDQYDRELSSFNKFVEGFKVYD